MDFTYDLAFYSDAFRLIKNTRICSFAVSPKDERAISVILTDGKVLFWNLNEVLSVLPTTNETNQQNRIPLVGLNFSAPPGPHVLHMCPPMTTKNWKEWQPVLAVGQNERQ